MRADKSGRESTEAAGRLRVSSAAGAGLPSLSPALGRTLENAASGVLGRSFAADSSKSRTLISLISWSVTSSACTVL